MRLLLLQPADTARRLGVSERVVRQARDDHATPAFIAAVMAYVGGEITEYFEARVKPEPKPADYRLP